MHVFGSIKTGRHSLSMFIRDSAVTPVKCTDAVLSVDEAETFGDVATFIHFVQVMYQV